MSVTTGRAADSTRRRQLALLAELREVDHWRRLVAARIDLAVAAVAAIDEPVVRNLPSAPAVPFGLRELLGLAAPGEALGEAELLLRLRCVQRDLDAYARSLRETTRTATQDLLSRLDLSLDAPAGRTVENSGGSEPGGERLAPVVVLAERRLRRIRRPRPDGAA